MRKLHWLDFKDSYWYTQWTGTDFNAQAMRVPNFKDRVQSNPAWYIFECFKEYLNTTLPTKLRYPPAIEAWSIFKTFEFYGKHIYKVGKDFGAVLLKANSKVSVNYLPFDNVVRCIEFHEDFVLDLKDGDYATCCYVACFQPDTGYLVEGEIFTKLIYLLAPIHNPNDLGYNKSFAHDQVSIYLKDGESLEDSIRCSLRYVKTTGFTFDSIAYILKCLLYLNSGQPDLREFRPRPRPHSPKKQNKWLRENFFPIPVTLLGFDYKKPKLISVDSTWIDTYPRWQPYGPGFSKVKLIWVEPHERHYKKDTEDAPKTSF